MNNFKLFLRFFVSRLLLAVCIRSYAQPDEFWQGPEVAHKDVYGYGHLTWEWTYVEPLRSPIYHSLFVVLYRILRLLQIDSDFMVSNGPRILQSSITALYDVYLIKLLTLEGVTNQSYIVLVNYTCWYSLYIMSRTLVNNFEACLIVIALYYWRRYTTQGKQSDNILCRCIVILNFAARGTSIVPWVFIWPFHLLTQKNSKAYYKDKFQTLLLNILTVSIMIIFSIGVDSWYHGKLTWCIWNFTKFNLIQGGASFYGEHSFFWLFGLVVPFMFLGWALFIPIGMYQREILLPSYHHIRVKVNSQLYPELGLMCLFFMGVVALSAHKEDRFLLPMFPIYILWICFGLEYVDKFLDKLRMREKWQFDQMQKLIYLRRSIIGLALVSNGLMLIFFFLFKDVGALTTIEKLRAQSNLKSVQFFVQCHSTPYYSYLHRDIPMYFPDCSPFQSAEKTENFKMYQNTTQFVEQALLVHQPSHIVIYNFLYDRVKDTQLRQYALVGSTFHALSTETSAGYFGNVYLLILSAQ